MWLKWGFGLYGEIRQKEENEKTAHSSTLPSLSFINCRHLTSNTQAQKLTQKTLSSEYFFSCQGGIGFSSRVKVNPRTQNAVSPHLSSLSKMTPNETMVPQANEVPTASHPRDKETALSEAALF